ncbi:MAG: porin family protein [Nitrococcus sp.]|nr:porin family protein [Nitrococcus sp.]
MKGVRKASIVVGAVAAFAASAQAASMPGGPYVGIVGGYQSTALDVSTALGGTTVKVDSLALTGARAGAILGWGAWGNDIYGALEVNGAMSFAEGNVRANGDKLNLESKETYGASVLFGHRVVSGALLYGRVGVQRMKATVSSGGESDNEWFNGIRAGVGGMWALSDAVAFRLEYTHAFYQSEKWEGAGSSVKLDPRENIFQAGFTVGF